MGHGMTKAERLREMERLYCERGFTDSEMSEFLDVDRTTIYRDRKALGDQLGIEIEKDHEGRYRIDRSQYLSTIRVSLQEALSLYLAARRASQQTKAGQRAAAGSLGKLALTLKQPMTQRLVKAANNILQRNADPLLDKVFEAAAQAWTEQRLLRIRYQGLEGKAPYPDTLAIYLIEPSPWSDSVYLIGHSDKLGKVVPYRLDRVEHVFVSGESYTLPADFNEDELLRYAWGIWRSDKEPETVQLRFKAGRAAKRLRESVWHPLEDITVLDNGDVIWSAPIAEPREMLPWIRGWGADCEVLGPGWLREQLITETIRLSQTYDMAHQEGVTNTMDVFEKFLSLPGKTDPPLTIFEHSSDVYHVALYLLESNAEEVQQWELVKSGALLHDVGKIEQDLQRGQWIHQPHSAKYLQPLLSHPRMQRLLADNEIDVSQVAHDHLLLICEHHHDISTQPELLRRNPDALLVSVADALASAIEGGWLGNIREMLAASPYIKLNSMLLSSLGLDGGLDDEIHRIDLPADTVAEALLCDLIYKDMCQCLRDHEFYPLLQRNGSLWVVGDAEKLKQFLTGYTVNPRLLYKSANIDNAVFENLLSSPSMPSPGSLEASSLKFLLVNEQIAKRMAATIALRKSTRQVLEYFDISVSEVAKIFGASDLAQSSVTEEE